MWKNAKTLCLFTGFRHFRGLPGLSDPAGPTHVHKHLVRIWLDVKVTQVAARITLQLPGSNDTKPDPHLTWHIRDPKSPAASLWASWMRNFHSSGSAGPPVPVSAVTTPLTQRKHHPFSVLWHPHWTHPDPSPFPTSTPAPQPLLRASWQLTKLPPPSCISIQGTSLSSCVF